MSDAEIIVRGTHTSYAAPERATVKLGVTIEGADAAEVLAACRSTVEAVRALIEPLHSPAKGPVTWWSANQVRTGAHRPWNQDGKQLPLVHQAASGFEVKFSDFAEMGNWISAVAAHRGVTIRTIEWALTVKRREQLVAEARVAAVADARAKAESYAGALGLQRVRALAVADAGMLVPGAAVVTPTSAAYSLSAAPNDGGFELMPDHIAVSADVDARFVAS